MSSYTKEELATYENEDSVEFPPSDIVAFNELRSCSDLLRMYKKKKLNIQPIFQREKVWKPKEYTRFIDSLMKQLPIPSLCFSHDYKTQKWEVIDGLQRISSIIQFLDEKEWRFSKLDDVDPRISGQKAEVFQDEESELYELYERVENLTLPITVVRCDLSKESHRSYLFTIFHRLNTGGTKLNNQEIRNCIFSGAYNTLIKDLNEDEKWVQINNITENKVYRFATVELILRFFAFHDCLSEYKGSLSKFLNKYLGNNINPDDVFITSKALLFERVTKLVIDSIPEATLISLSLTVMEALMHGVAVNIDTLENKTAEEVFVAYNNLRAQAELSPESLSEGLASKDKVIGRLTKSADIFSI
ncbi:MAG: DUF262 domain-containing protein [Colwellia sp.]|nr:DUF262 domain-containing protein [Colwellia sp.]NQZ83294.1 DUF262 domain-containing protein [Colwellia sp.]